MAKAIPTGSEELGQMLQRRREALNMSRRDLVDATKLSYPYVSQLETGLRKPSAAAAQRLAKVLNLSLDEIFAVTDQTSQRNVGFQLSDVGTAPPPRTRHEIVRELLRLLEELPADSRLSALAELQTQVMQRLVDDRVERSKTAP